MNQEDSICLIELYAQYRFLWDAKDKVHQNRMNREDAWKEMSSKLQYPVATLKAKMKTLMGSYRSERSREKKCRITGSGSDELYNSKWFAYKYFEFLADKDIPRETVNTASEEHSEIEVPVTPTSPTVIPAEYTPATTATATTATATTATATTATATTATATTTSAATSCSTTRQQMSQETTFPTPNTSRRQRTGIKCKAAEQESDSMMHEAMQILKSSVKSSYAYFTYALNLANELRKYDRKSLAHVKQAFAYILFEADMGMYSASYGITLQIHIPHSSPSASSHSSHDYRSQTSTFSSNAPLTTSDTSENITPEVDIQSVLLDM